MRRMLTVATFGSAALFASAAFAATTTGTLSVNASVSATCSIGAATLAFGSYDPSSTVPLQISTTLPVTCTSGTSYQVGLSAGAGTNATITSRSMTGATGGNTTPLNYGLYQDAGYTTNWGNTPGTDTPAAATGTGSTVDIPVYGEIPAGQYVPADSYSDTVTATVTY